MYTCRVSQPELAVVGIYFCMIAELTRFGNYYGLLLDTLHYCYRLKVSLFQNDFWISSFEPKNERKYICISALASKMGQIIKIMAHYLAT